MILKQAFNTIMQSEMIGKIFQNEALVESILKAITSSLRHEIPLVLDMNKC